ncbi:UvrD-helicase-domain-containing protein [Xylariaceae sp. FL0255]|nr:UvrD-helicase-domain-containing protein [Xylariaceae sp. FL0255]
MSTTKSTNVFDSLNKAQRRAVSSDAPTVAILAGPGSGKTHTLTSRVVWLIDHVGIQPRDVLVATFTVKAANEMKARIGQALGDGREKKIVLGTFHSIARRYLAAYGQRIGLDPKFGIADDSDSRGIVTRICKRLDVNLEPPIARAWISKRKAKGTSDEQMLKGKNGKSIESQALETCFQEYQSHLERSNLLDYDDLLVRCVDLLRRYPQCVSNIQTVLIDEYQDTNGVQYDLMKLFAQRHRRITIVGDPDQSIYGWRSAEIKNLHRMLRDYPGTDEISLEENYRSSSSILDTSLKVIQQDQDRYKKVLLPVHEKCTQPVLRKLKNSTNEADWIISEVKRVRMLSGNMIDFDDVAILLRSAFLSRHIESTLGREGIAYRMVGGFKFYERTEIKILLDYMRIIHQPDNNDALARVINVPKRGIGDVTIKALVEEAEKSSISLWKLLDRHCRGGRQAKTNLRKQTEISLSGSLLRPLDSLRKRVRPTDRSATPMNLVDLIQQLVRDLKFEDYLESTYGPEYESRWSNVQEFVTLAEEFMRQGQVEDDSLPAIDGVAQTMDDDVLAKFLSNVSLASDKQTDNNDQEGKPQVTISTIHAAKGLEWPVVFIPAVYHGSIPHIRAEDQNEERRLLYVAMTRAKALLYLSCPKYTAGSGGGESSTTQLSPFIDGLSSSVFLQKGPSFDRPVMSQVAKILRRDLPPDNTIYKNMPSMTAPEDNLFPVDPDKPSRAYHQDGSGPRKRQKLNYPGTNNDRVDESTVEGWAAPYKTTMDRASSFTLPQGVQMGFTTAGAHHLANPAAPETKHVPNGKLGPHGAGVVRRTTSSTSNRPPGQRSLLGYGYGVANHDNSNPPPQPIDNITTLNSNNGNPSALKRTFSAPAPYARRQAAFNHRQQQQQQQQPFLPPALPSTTPAIEPELANHKLIPANAKLPSKPVPQPNHTEEKHESSSSTKQKQYTCFSSSPVRDTSGATEEKENVEPPATEEEQTRPAASFHATTTMATGWNRNRGGGGLSGGHIKRPVGLGRSGITPLEKLNKPYKLTIKRP